MLALDPLACAEIWADGAHSCVRDDKHQGPHRCDCGKTRKPAPKKKPKKPKRSTLKNKADRLWSLAVRSRGYCQLSGKDGVSCAGNLQAAHLIGRRFHSTRFDLENGWALCQGHHTFYTHRPEAWFLLLERLEPGLYERLWSRAQVPWDKDIEAVIEVLKSLSGEGAP